MKQILFIIALSISIFTSETSAQTLQDFFQKTNAFLGTYVSGGKVDYKSISMNPDGLNEILALAKDISVTPSQANEYQAFWINAYNLAVIKGIIDNAPIKSPLDKQGFFDSIKYELGSTKITLNDIEHKLLRPKFKDARFHFVLVCGANGCPPLISKAYLPSTLDTQLETQTVKALNNPAFIKVTGKKVAFSEIFKWYKEDFVSKGMNEIDYLNKYRKEPIPSDKKITYYAYDWRVNSK